MSVDLTRSWYRASARRWREHPPLLDSIDCDIAVIGAGLTGLNAALTLREAGQSVVVLEARQPGWGASGRSGGQLIFGYGMAPDTLAKQPQASALWQLGQSALKRVGDLCKKYGIECDYQAGHIHAALNAGQLRTLATWQSVLRRRFDHFDSELMDQRAIRSAIATERYIGGLRDRSSAHIHPLNYTLGLADAALRAGCRIFGGTAVQHIAPGTPVTLQTPGGTLRCKHLVVACNAYLGSLLPELAQRFLPVGSYIGATAPLEQSLIPHREAVADMNHLLAYYRMSRDNRLLFGARVGLSNQPPADLSTRLQQRMQQTFPQLQGTGFDYVWGGLVGVTQKRLPQLGLLTDNIWFAQAYSGHGMALSGLAGQLLAEAIQGRSARFDLLAQIPQRAIPGGRWGQALLLPIASSWLRLMDKLGL